MTWADGVEGDGEVGWVTFRDLVLCGDEVSDGGKKSVRLTAALGLIYDTLVRMFGKFDMRRLVDSGSCTATRRLFSSTANAVARDRGWAASTYRGIWSAMKGLLRRTHIDRAFVNVIKPEYRAQPGDASSVAAVASTTDECVARLLRCVARTDAGADQEQVRKVLTEWVTKLRAYTRQRSPGSVRNIMTFIMTLCRDIGYPPSTWPASGDLGEAITS